MARRDNEYRCCGTANIFAVVEPKIGRYLTRTTPNRSAAEFALETRVVVAAYAFGRKIRLVMNNLSIHCRKSLTDRFGPKGREQPGRLRQDGCEER